MITKLNFRQSFTVLGIRFTVRQCRINKMIFSAFLAAMLLVELLLLRDQLVNGLKAKAMSLTKFINRVLRGLSGRSSG